MTNQKTDNEGKMPISEHIKELRRRVVFSLAAITAGLILSGFFARNIFHLLQAPLLNALPHDSKFITLNAVEGWLVYFKVSFISSLFISSPFWLYQIWAFFAPAVGKERGRKILFYTFLSSALFIGGGLAGYFIILPYGFSYFISILEATGIVFLPQMRLYLNFTLFVMVALGLVFQVPLVILFLIKWNIVSVEKFKKARKYIIVLAFIIAAVATPPDVITQIIVAFPLIALFELSLLGARLMKNKKTLT
jgi:sec-independent protein translocase protein TatC